MFSTDYLFFLLHFKIDVPIHIRNYCHIHADRSAFCRYSLNKQMNTLKKRIIPPGRIRGWENNHLQVTMLFTSANSGLSCNWWHKQDCPVPGKPQTVIKKGSAAGSGSGLRFSGRRRPSDTRRAYPTATVLHIISPFIWFSRCFFEIVLIKCKK